MIVISGFGPKTVRNLLDWRAGLERKFRFDASRGVSLANTAAVENAVGLQSRRLEQGLASGLAELRLSISRETAVRAQLRARFQEIAPAYGQALADKRAAAVL